jgi:predicted MFS family arabinose efflux permease
MINTIKTGNNAWLVVGLLWVVAFLNYLDRILITSMRDPIVAEFKLTDAQFGLLTSVFLWSYGVFKPGGRLFCRSLQPQKSDRV